MGLNVLIFTNPGSFGPRYELSSASRTKPGKGPSFCI